MNKKVLHFDVDTSFVKIKEIMKNKDFIQLEFRAISDEYPNNNASHFPYATFQSNIDNGSFYNKPILGKFNNATNNYETHIYKKKYDPEFDMEYYDYEDGERPLGLIRESDKVWIETTNEGLHWIVFNAVLWVKYNYKGVKKLLQSKNSKVSVEVTIVKSHEDENGIEIFDEWIFDGVTILGYKPNTRIPVKEGINNARLTINELMDKQIFNNQLKTLCFAYEELNNDDIKEESTRLYKYENNKGMEGCRMSYDEKKNALETLLCTFVEDSSSLHVEDFDDTSVKFNFCDIVYKVEYSEEDGNIFINFDNKEEFQKQEELQEQEEFQEQEELQGQEEFKEKEEPTDDEKECKMTDVEKECKMTDVEDECKMFKDNECGKDDLKNGDQCGGNKFEDDGKKDPEDTDVDDGDDTDTDDPDDKDDECNTFLLDDGKFTGEQLVDKYVQDMAAKDEAYNALKQQYSELLSQKTALEEKVKIYETEKEKVRMATLCKEVSSIAKKEGFDETEVDSLLQKCKNKEFSTVEDAVKEIAYIVFTRKENNEKQESTKETVEFSAKVVEQKKEQDKTKTKKSSFENLKDYVNK